MNTIRSPGAEPNLIWQKLALSFYTETWDSYNQNGLHVLNRENIQFYLDPRTKSLTSCCCFEKEANSCPWLDRAPCRLCKTISASATAWTNNYQNHPHDPPTFIIQENETSFPTCKEWYTENLSTIDIGTISFIRIEKSPFSKWRRNRKVNTSSGSHRKNQTREDRKQTKNENHTPIWTKVPAWHLFRDHQQ
jgi:hypothetical protein